MGWKRKDLLSLQDLETAEIQDVLDTADSMREISLSSSPPRTLSPSAWRRKKAMGR